ncbi:MAG TPA: ABATE domain-containing protein [Candidatus Acidoferrales bacterium]|nr:ABATE domain-containing protein [Candidatus Acidoferrales bacterium]
MTDHPAPFFIAGSAGLDFLNSIATPADQTVDWIATGEGLVDWLQQAGFLDSDTASAIGKEALPGEIDWVAAQARVLREWFRAFVRAHKGRPLARNVLSDLEPLNQLLSRDKEFDQVVWTPDDSPLPFRRARLRRWTTPDTLLQPIGAALADVVCSENFSNIKACQGSHCTLLYVDRTRRLARRWCSMAVCGNRSKQASHRDRTIGRLAT